MMRNVTIPKATAYLLGTYLLAGCGSDSASSESDPRPPTVIPTPPENVVSGADNPVVSMLSHELVEGGIHFNFELLNQREELVTGLVNAKVMVAEKVLGKGFVQSPEGLYGGSATTGTVGTELTEPSPGNYVLFAPIAGIDGSEEVIIWLQVGQESQQIGLSTPLIVQSDFEELNTQGQDCYRCHVDYAAGNGHHAEYVAVDSEGNTDFISGCKVCHNDVDRAQGGYSNITLSYLGHVKHKSFERVDFTMMHCQSCHVGEFAQIEYNLGCIDCHGSEAPQSSRALSDISGFSQSADESIVDVHDKLNQLQEFARENRTSHTSEPFLKAGVQFGAEIKDAVCVTTNFIDTSSETPKHIDVEGLLNSGGAWDMVVDIKAHFNGRLVGTVADYAFSPGWADVLVTPKSGIGFSESNGDWTTCFPEEVLERGFTDADLVGVGRLFLTQEDMPFMSYSSIVDRNLEIVAPYVRVQRDNQQSCSNCHNVSRFTHNTIEGSKDCLVCHDNGMAPGFSMAASAHRFHFGKVTPNLTPEVFNGNDCMVCHEGGVDMEVVPNGYIKSNWMPFNESDQFTNKLASPIMASCYDCHQDAAAISHMQAMGGEYAIEVTDGWYRESTSEACAVCHAIGSSVGIERYHKFKRDAE